MSILINLRVLATGTWLVAAAVVDPESRVWSSSISQVVSRTGESKMMLRRSPETDDIPKVVKLK